MTLKLAGSRACGNRKGELPAIRVTTVMKTNQAITGGRAVENALMSNADLHPDPSGAGNCHCQPGTLMPILGFLMFDAAIASDDK